MSDRIPGYDPGPYLSDRVATPEVAAVVNVINDLASERGVEAPVLAHCAGMGHGAYLRRSEGRFPFSIDEVDALARALGLSLFELVERAQDEVRVSPRAPRELATDAAFEVAPKDAQRHGWAMQGA